MAGSFQPRFVDLVRNYSNTSGTGNLVLGNPVEGFTNFADAMQPGDQFYYSVLGLEKAGETEVGRGTLQMDGSIARDPISGTLTDFSSGTKTVALIAAAEWFSEIQERPTEPADGDKGDITIANGVWSLDAGAPNIADKVQHSADRVALANAVTNIPAAFLCEAGREGMFVWDGADHSALVAADPHQGIYVAPSSDPTGATGAWVRQFTGALLPQWFGAIADDDDVVSGTDNGVAFAAMIKLIEARSRSSTPIYRGAADEILIAGRFYVGAFTFEPLTTLKMRGIGGKGMAPPSRLRFAANTTALRAQSYNTSGDTTVDGASHCSGDSWVIEDICFLGASDGSTGTEGDYHGCHAKRPVFLNRCTFYGFQGDGLYADSTGDGGLADCGHAYNCTFTNCRNGRYMVGGDSNVWTFVGCQYTSNRRWGVRDSSFLGNYEFGAHNADNGITGTLTAYTMVSYNGRRYAVIEGQESAASTNAPSGTTEDNSYWYYCYDAGPVATVPLWTSGISLRSGGAYSTTSIDATNGFYGCYSESAQGPSQFVTPTLVSGGAHAAGIKGSAAYLSNNGGNLQFGNGTQGAIVNGNFQWNAKGGTAYSLSGFNNSADVNLDLKTGNVASQINAYNSDGSPAGYMAWISGNYYLNNQNSGGTIHFRIGGTDIAQLNSAALNLNSGKVLQVDGTQVIAARQTGTAADATDLASAVALVNDLKAKLIVHGLIS